MSDTSAELAASVQNDDDVLLLRRRHRPKGGVIEGLNLTAMMDVMTILLVFLLKQYASAPENITLNDDLRPPASSTKDELVPAVSVLISKSIILVDNKPVMKVEDGKAVAGGGVNPYQPLQDALVNRVSTINAIAARGGAPFDGKLMLIADEETPYDVVSKVLYEAGHAQFTSYRLIVRRK